MLSSNKNPRIFNSGQSAQSLRVESRNSVADCQRSIHETSPFRRPINPDNLAQKIFALDGPHTMGLRRGIGFLQPSMIISTGITNTPAKRAPMPFGEVTALVTAAKIAPTYANWTTKNQHAPARFFPDKK